MRIIGLTGGIASGKSLVSEILAELGAVVIDADQLAREVVKPGTGPYREIVGFFGEKVLQPDGTLDRKALGGIVFADAGARKRLEQITHPAINQLARDRIEAERRGGTQAVFYMVPLLLEAGLSSSVDEIWVVHVDEGTQLKRLMNRDKIGREEALRKISAQMPMDEKMKCAHVLIDNSGAPEETGLKVRKLWQELMRRIREGGEGF
jgi:dephospho-CoA kinase